MVLPVIDRLAAMAGAGRYTITADAESRGEVASSQAGTTAQWIAERCPSLDSREAVLAGLITMGGVDGAAGVRRLRPAVLAQYGLGEVLQEVEDRHAGLTVLSCGRDIGGGITEYRLRLNPEARAVVEAAINTASAPKVVDGSRTLGPWTNAAATPSSACAGGPPPPRRWSPGPGPRPP